MSEPIERLKELQSVDNGIRSAREHIARLNAEIRKTKREIRRLGDSLNRESEDVKALTVAQHGKETELAAIEIEIARLQLQLNQAKSNKEFTALKYEIRVLNEKKSALEDNILGIMERLDRGDAERDRLRLEVEERQAQAETEAEEARETIASLEALLAELAERRAAVTQHIDANTLRVYERIHKGLADGKAVAAVKAGACQGCLMSVPPNVINRLMMPGQLVICQSCSRIQYLDKADWPQ